MALAVPGVQRFKNFIPKICERSEIHENLFLQMTILDKIALFIIPKTNEKVEIYENLFLLMTDC